MRGEMFIKLTRQLNVREQTDEIFSAKNKIIELTTQWLDFIHMGHLDAAARIRRQQNGIKREIRNKYDILID
jgi:hypothetical protein